jgi:hypothetical protein
MGGFATGRSDRSRRETGYLVVRLLLRYEATLADDDYLNLCIFARLSARSPPECCLSPVSARRGLLAERHIRK